MLSLRTSLFSLSAAASAVALAIVQAPAAVSAASADWVVTSAKRTIYASGNVAQVDVKITAKVLAEGGKQDFVVTAAKKYGKPGHIIAYGSSPKNALTVEKYNATVAGTAELGDDFVSYRVLFNKGMDKGKTVTFTYSMYLGKPYEPLPKEIHLFQRQFLQYFDTLRVPSIYAVESQTSFVELASSGTQVDNIEPAEFGKKEGKSSGTIKFGPFDEKFDFFDKKSKDVAEKHLMVHFANQEHQTYFPSVKREIEVSHWGNVAFKENYELKHAGAAVSSAFNRVGFSWGDYRKRGMQAPENPVATAMYEMNVVLPRTARNIHYRDEIGNISTSNARRDDKGYVLAQIRPRYPVLGGWNADWEFSYDVPTRSALKVDPFDPTLHVLNITMSPPIVRTYAGKLSVEVLLPEGAHDIKLYTPSNKVLSSEWTGNKNSWLDFFGGRPVIGYEIDDFYVPEKQILQYKFQVTYRFQSFKMYYEPILLSVMLFIGFFSYIMVGRSSLRIVRKGEKLKLDQKDIDTAVMR